MTPAGVAQLLGYLSIAYPRPNPPDAFTPDLWMEQLAAIDDEVALAAAKRWVHEQKWMPSVAEIAQACRTIVAVEDMRRRALPSGHLDREASVAARDEVTGELREVLARKALAEHDHHGPAPCPVCGGVVGKLGDQRRLGGA